MYNIFCDFCVNFRKLWILFRNYEYYLGELLSEFFKKKSTILKTLDSYTLYLLSVNGVATLMAIKTCNIKKMDIKIY